MRLPLPLLALALVAGCAPAETPPSPEGTALELFTLERDPEAERLQRLFGIEPDARDLSQLLDTLDRLPRDPTVRFAGTAAADGEWWVDLEVDAGGETQSWSVAIVETEEGYRVSWLGGPGGSWPRRSLPRRYTGLSVSTVPGGG